MIENSVSNDVFDFGTPEEENEELSKDGCFLIVSRLIPNIIAENELRVVIGPLRAYFFFLNLKYGPTY